MKLRRTSFQTALLFYSGLLVVTVLASLPALGGSWIYDDFTMLNNPELDGPEDIVAAFGNVSADYLRQRTSGEGGAVTYRPLPWISFLLPFLADGQTPLLNHLLSLVLHSAAIWLILAIDLRMNLRLTVPGALIAILYALHPMLSISWVWIMGRFDLLAALFILWIAWLLTPPANPEQAPLSRSRLLALPIAALGAFLCKETSLPLVAALFVAASVPNRLEAGFSPWKALKAATPGFIVFTLAVAVYFGLRSNAASGHLAFPSLLPLFERWPLTLAGGVESFLNPFPRPMKMLAYEHWTGWSASRLLCLTALACGIGALAYFRRARALILLVGSVTPLLLVGYIADYYWQGFDRYFHGPALLGFLAILWRAPGQGEAVRFKLQLYGLLALALLLAVSLFYQAKIYHSQKTFVQESLVMDRESGIGQMWVARQQQLEGKPQDALKTLEEIKPLDLPSPALRNAAAIALDCGNWEIAPFLLEEALKKAPGFAGAKRDILLIRAWQNRWEDVESISQDLLSQPSSCAQTAGYLKTITARFPPPSTVNQKLKTHIANSPCTKTGL